MKGMNISKRQRRLAAQNEFKKPITVFEQIDLSIANFVPKGMTRAFRNTRFTVMIYDNSVTSHCIATKALIQKHDDTPIVNHWAEMQKIKNEIFGKEVTAVEYYPSESNLINDHNIYWMWVFPNGVLPIFSPNESQPLHHQGRTVEEDSVEDNELLSWVAIFYGALKELVELKELKETLYKGNPDGREYAERKPLAWYAAKQAIELWKKSDYGALPLTALQPPPTAEQGEGTELLKKLVIAVKDNYCVDLQVQLAEEYLKNHTPS